MDSKMKVYQDGNGLFYAIDSLGNKIDVSPSDLSSERVASSLRPGEYITVKTNKYSELNCDKLTSVDMTRCTYNFNIKK